MAYSRFSYADVYVFMDVHGTLECCGCSLGDEWNFGSTEAMIDHIAEHRAAGHDVPDGLEDELRSSGYGWNSGPQSCPAAHCGGKLSSSSAPNKWSRLITRRKCNRCHWID